MGKKLTTEEFIAKSKVIHEDKYDYSLVNYVNNNIKLIRIPYWDKNNIESIIKMALI